MKVCRACGATAGFVKSHIIPEAFFRELRDGGDSPLLVSGVQGVFPKRAPIGVYDHTILCSTCESKFQALDTYGIEVLLTRFDEHFTPLRKDGATGGFESEGLDKLRLLDFFVSVLWRASVSTQPFYKTVSLGPYERIVLETVVNGLSGAPDAFDAVLSRWKDDDDGELPTTGVMNPHRERWGDVNAYRLYLGKVVAYVRVDRRPFSEQFSAISLRSEGPCRIVSRRLATSKDLDAMRKTAVASDQNLSDFRLKAKLGLTHRSIGATPGSKPNRYSTRENVETTIV